MVFSWPPELKALVDVVHPATMNGLEPQDYGGDVNCNF